MVEYALAKESRLVGDGNARVHWADRHRRHKRQRQLAEMALLSTPPMPRPELPVVVTITRIGAGVMDQDNLASSCKGTQDGVAAWLGVDDGDESAVTWRYRQERCRRGWYGVRIEWRPR